MATALRMIVVAMLFIGIDVRFGAGVDLVPDLIGAVLVVVALATGLHGRHRYFDWALPAAVVVLIAAVIDLLAPPEGTLDVVRLLDAIATGAAAWLVLSGVAHIARLQRNDRIARDASIAAAVVLAASAVSVAFAVAGFGSDSQRHVTVHGGTAVVVVLAVVGAFAFAVWVLVTLLRAARALHDPAHAQAAATSAAPSG